MAFQRAVSCNENPIDDIERDLLQAVSDSHTEISALIDDAELDVPDIDELLDVGNDLLQDLLNAGNADSELKVIDDLSATFGIDGNGTQKEDEEYLRNVMGLILINGVIFKEGEISPNIDNIEVLRRVYQGASRDLAEVERIYQSQINNSFVFETIIQTLEPTELGKNPTLEEIRRRLGVPWVVESQVVYTEKNQAIVAYRKSVAENEPLQTVSNRTNVPLERLTSTIVHYKEILSTTASINYWVALGYKDEISFILDGVDPVDANPLPITNSLQVLKDLASAIITDIEFVLSRIDKLGQDEIEKLRGRLQIKLNQLELLLIDAINTILFKVSVMQEEDTLTQLRNKLSDEDIVYMLDERPDVLGIDLDASIEELNAIASQSKSIRAGDITASSKFLNRTVDSRSEVLPALLNMFSLVQQAKEQTSTMTREDLEKAKNTLIELIGVDPTAQPEQGNPVRGFPGMATPSAIMAQRVDIDRSFEINLKFGALDDALAKFNELFSKFITGPITALVKMISNLFKAAHTLIDNLINKIKNKILPLKRKLDGFMAKYLSLIGQGVFNNSLLKCAVNFNIGLSTNILDQLLKMIEDLGKLAQNLITKFQKIIAAMIEKILCVPIQMVDKLIAQGESYLPSFCKITIPFGLGEDLEKALLDLRNACSFKQVNFTGFSGDLVSYRAIVTTANNRLNQFNKSSFCQSDLVDNAFNTTLVNIQGGIPSPSIPSPF